MTQFETFLATYTEKLAETIKRRPDEYFYPPSDAPKVAEKMTRSLREGTANVHNSPAIKATCRALSLPCRIGAIKKFLEGSTP